MKEIYEIRIKGHLDNSWAHTFEGMTMILLPGGETLLRGEVADQAALQGLLERIYNYGLTLLLVRKVEYDPQDISQGSEQPFKHPNRT